MDSIWIGALSFGRAGQRLRATLTVLSDRGPVPGAVVTIKMASPAGGVFRDFTANAQGIIVADTPSGYTLRPGDPNDIKVCWISAPGYEWDNTRGVSLRQTVSA